MSIIYYIYNTTSPRNLLSHLWFILKSRENHRKRSIQICWIDRGDKCKGGSSWSIWKSRSKFWFWGLGRVTDNQVESLALYQELKILDLRRIRKLIVMGDSTMIVRLVHYSLSFYGNLARLILWIQKEASCFGFAEYFHVLRDWNL